MADIKARRVFLPRMHPMRRGCKTIYVIYIYVWQTRQDKTGVPASDASNASEVQDYGRQ